MARGRLTQLCPLLEQFQHPARSVPLKTMCPLLGSAGRGAATCTAPIGAGPARAAARGSGGGRGSRTAAGPAWASAGAFGGSSLSAAIGALGGPGFLGTHSYWWHRFGSSMMSRWRRSAIVSCSDELSVDDSSLDSSELVVASSSEF